jgi:hypothetical protein
VTGAGSRSWRPLLAPALLAFPVVFLFLDVLVRGHVLYERDILGWYYGQAEAFVQCIGAGSWPLWDPWMGFGQPLLADPAAQIFYPWTWLNLVLSPGTYYTVFAVGHVWLSGVGMLLLARRLGLGEAASLLAGAIWMTSGPFLSLVSLCHHFTGASLMPFVLLAADRALEGGGVRRALVWGGVVALQVFAGSADVFAMTLLLQAGILVRQVRREGGRSRNRALASATAVAVVFAVGLSAPQWWPSFEALKVSSRADLPLALRTYWSVQPAALLQVLLPVIPRDLPLRPGVRERFFEGREPFINSLYLGLAVLPLVVASFAGKRILFAVALAGVALASTAFALGSHGPIYGLAVTVLPPLGVFRYPVKALVLLTFAWALLAGLGLEAWRASKRLGLILGLISLLSGLAAVLGAGAVSRVAGRFLAAEPAGITVGEAGATVESAFAIAGAIALLGALLLVTRPGRWSVVAVVALAVADLTLAHARLNPSAPREIVERPPVVLHAIRREGLDRLYSFDYQHPIPGKTPRRSDPHIPLSPDLLPLPPHLRQTLATYGLLPSGTLARFRLFGSYDWDLIGLAPASFRDLVLFFLIQEDTPGFRRLLQLGSVTHVIALHSEGLENLDPAASIGSPFSRNLLRLYRVPDRLPRAYAAAGARIANGPQARALLVDPGFDPAREIVLPEGVLRPTTSSSQGQVQIVSYRPDRVHLVADLDAPGFVVLTDAYDPGWRVTVDGRVSPLLRANEIFRAAEVPAGHHEVEFVYRPRSVVLGLLVAGLVLVAGLAAVTFTGRKTLLSASRGALKLA